MSEPPEMDCKNGVHHFDKRLGGWYCLGCPIVLTTMEIAFCRGKQGLLDLVKRKEEELANRVSDVSNTQSKDEGS